MRSMLLVLAAALSGCASQAAPPPPPPPSSAMAAPPACLTAAQFYDLVKQDLDDPAAYRLSGDVICQDGWATAAVGSTTPSESPENAYYLLRQDSTGWVVAAFGTESWLFAEKPLCQRVPDRIAERLCLKGG